MTLLACAPVCHGIPRPCNSYTSTEAQTASPLTHSLIHSLTYSLTHSLSEVQGRL